MLEKITKTARNTQQDAKKGGTTVNTLKYLQKKTRNKITCKFPEVAIEKTELLIKRKLRENKKQVQVKFC